MLSRSPLYSSPYCLPSFFQTSCFIVKRDNESQLGLEVGTSKVTRGNQRQLGGGGQLEQLGVTEINQN